MTDFVGEQMQGSRFEEVDLAGARFRNVDLTGATIRGALLVDVDIDGDIRNLRINGVEIEPLVEAELDRRHPERALLRASDAQGFRDAWAMIERSWRPTVAHARRLPPEVLHERVEGEWSFIETLRHLVFATDAWVKRALQGDPAPYHPLDLPHTEMGDVAGVPNDPDVRPELDDVLALRADRFGVVRDVLADLTDDALAGTTEPNPAPGYPAADTYPISRCLRAVVNEEWLHRLYAERDLAVLETRSSDPDRG